MCMPNVRWSFALRAVGLLRAQKTVVPLINLWLHLRVGAACKISFAPFFRIIIMCICWRIWMLNESWRQHSAQTWNKSVAAIDQHFGLSNGDFVRSTVLEGILINGSVSHTPGPSVIQETPIQNHSIKYSHWLKLTTGAVCYGYMCVLSTYVGLYSCIRALVILIRWNLKKKNSYDGIKIW